MRESVRAAFFGFTVPMEGVVPWLYVDVKGLVSVGIGNLIDPMPLALGLPFVHPDGRPASRDEIAAEWTRIKNQPPDAHGRTAAELGHLYAKQIATLHLTDEGVERLVSGKLAENEHAIARTFADWEDWPADAQLATHSMAWACGAGIFDPHAGHAHWPKLTAALHARDFRTAAVECFMPEEAKIGGLRPRNRANRILYTNAALAMQMFDPSVLHYPTELESETPTIEVVVPSRRPPRIEDFATVHAPIDFPPRTVRIPGDDEPPPQAA